MPKFFRCIPALCACLCLWACSPSFDWRDFKPASSRLQALMPCKPDEAMRKVPLADEQVEMHLAGCDAGGATFIVGWAGVSAERLGAAMGEWQDSTLQRAGIPSGPDAPLGRSFVPAGGLTLPQSVRLQAEGHAPGGAVLPLRAAWFATGGAAPQAMFAAVYREPGSPDAVETFFAGLHMR